MFIVPVPERWRQISGTSLVCLLSSRPMRTSVSQRIQQEAEEEFQRLASGTRCTYTRLHAPAHMCSVPVCTPTERVSLFLPPFSQPFSDHIICYELSQKIQSSFWFLLQTNVLTSPCSFLKAALLIGGDRAISDLAPPPSSSPPTSHSQPPA